MQVNDTRAVLDKLTSSCTRIISISVLTYSQDVLSYLMLLGDYPRRNPAFEPHFEGAKKGTQKDEYRALCLGRTRTVFPLRVFSPRYQRDKAELSCTF